MSVIPMVLSGGSGTRLWPLSRRSKPKQFLSFSGDMTLFQDTITRCRGSLFEPRPLIVGSDDQRFMIAEDLRTLGVDADILLEPVPRNSCAAIAAGCLQALARDRDAIVLALAADHIIADADAFTAAVASALSAAQDGFLVTFGIRPDRPATGYGYIQPGESIGSGSCLRVGSFVEKPGSLEAQRYLSDGFLWNSGNFLFKAQVFLDELAKYQPEILSAVRKAFNNVKSDLDFLRLDESAFKTSPSISVDYGVIEKTERIAVIPVSYAWSDMGSWDSVWEICDKDDQGNAVIGEGFVLGGQNNLVHSEPVLTTLVGVEDLLVVATSDSVLVASKSGAEHVKALVGELQKQGRTEATEALRIFRPWGNYERLDIGESFQVKRLVINPGGVLSLQKHSRRAEHWVIVSGEAEVTIGDEMQTMRANQSIYVPLGAVHRLANSGPEPAILIEVQTGDYFGEDDIIRFEDTYNRTAAE